MEQIQGDNKVAGQAFLALWAKWTKILKKCKYISNVYILASKNVKMIFVRQKSEKLELF